MSYFQSICLLFSSFSPLWVAVLFIDIKSIVERRPFVVTEYLSIVIIGLLFLISVKKLSSVINSTKRNKREAQAFTLNAIKKQKSVTAEFVLSYIVPLIAFDFTQWDGVVLFGIFFLLLAFLCAKHSYFSVNVLLELFGYRFYSCELINSNGITIEKNIKNNHSLVEKKGEDIYLFDINNEYCLEAEIKKD